MDSGLTPALRIAFVPVAQVRQKKAFSILPIGGSIVPLGMQGKKDYQEKLFARFQLSERVPENNFYRRLKNVIDLDFLYPLTKGYYGESGQKSIDPVVFFKSCLIRYLENMIGDRQLVDHYSMRLDILYFIGYDTVEPVFGTLTQFMGLRKINTIGIQQANKAMHPSAIAYNLKKYLKFEWKRSKTATGGLPRAVSVKNGLEFLFEVFSAQRKIPLYC